MKKVYSHVMIISHPNNKDGVQQCTKYYPHMVMRVVVVVMMMMIGPRVD